MIYTAGSNAVSVNMTTDDVMSIQMFTFHSF